MPDSAVIEASESHEPPAGEARLLRGATQVLFQASDDPVRDRHWLCAPLSRAVANHSSRRGQAICAQLGAALATGDHQAALDACRRLVHLEISSALGAIESWQ